MGVNTYFKLCDLKLYFLNVDLRMCRRLDNVSLVLVQLTSDCISQHDISRNVW